MNPYLRNESEAQEFDYTVNIALKLFAKSKKKRQMAEKNLLSFGAKSVRPMAYTIELALWDKSISDYEVDERAEDVSEIILQIGKDALPDLNYLATNGGCNMYVNEWAQELIFKIMGVDGEEKQKACHHFGFLLYSEEDKNILICPTCGSRIPAQKRSDSGDQ